MKLLALSATALTTVLLGALLTTSTEATPPAIEGTAYKVDASHTSVIFRTKHFDLAWARGSFNEIAGEVVFDPKAPTEAEVSFVIQAGSVDTNNERRDEHLRGPDFFTVKQFPEIKFESKSIEAGDGGVLLATGVVSWMGREVETTATIEHIGEGPNAGGAPSHGFHAELTLKRSDFGMTYGLPKALGDLVFIEIDTEVNAPR